MRLAIIIAITMQTLLAQSKSVGLQYDYVCISEGGEFAVQVITVNGGRTSAKVAGHSVLPYSLEFVPRLGSMNARLYFLGAPGEDEQNNQCRLTSSNSRLSSPAH